MEEVSPDKVGGFFFKERHVCLKAYTQVGRDGSFRPPDPGRRGC